VFGLTDLPTNSSSGSRTLLAARNGSSVFVTLHFLRLGEIFQILAKESKQANSHGSSFFATHVMFPSDGKYNTSLPRVRTQILPIQRPCINASVKCSNKVRSTNSTVSINQPIWVPSGQPSRIQTRSWGGQNSSRKKDHALRSNLGYLGFSWRLKFFKEIYEDVKIIAQSAHTNT
jgi:hypothetical protein